MVIPRTNWITHPDMIFAKRRDAKSAKEVTKTNESEKTVWAVKASGQAFSVSTESSSQYIVKRFNMDSACTTTIVTSREGIMAFDPTDVQQFTLADKSGVSSTDTGIIMGKGKNLKVHVVPSFGESLLSIPHLFDRGIATVFHPTYGVMIADAKNMVVTCATPLERGRYVDGTFLLNFDNLR
jgi:hypothetical protein